VSLGGFLHLLLDLVVGGVLAKFDGEVNDGNIGGRNAESHTSELAVKLGDDLADSLGSSSGAGDNVGAGSAASAPVLATLGGTVNGELVNGDGVDGGHETLLDSPVVIKDLCDRGEAVGSAGSVGDNLHVTGVLLVVDTDDEDGGVILGRAGDDGLFGTTLDVVLSGGFAGEDTGGLADVVGTVLAPGDEGGVLLSGDGDEVAVNLDATVGLFDSSLEDTYANVRFKMRNLPWTESYLRRYMR